MKLKVEERTIQEKRQEMESRLRRLVWIRLMKRVETIEEEAQGQHYR